uniref:Uncharacterized protein n=1 Tax=Globodera rostochiensis TaxID=31243 RepID=A0A914IBM5_GLORO
MPTKAGHGRLTELKPGFFGSKTEPTIFTINREERPLTNEKLGEDLQFDCCFGSISSTWDEKELLWPRHPLQISPIHKIIVRCVIRTLTVELPWPHLLMAISVLMSTYPGRPPYSKDATTIFNRPPPVSKLSLSCLFQLLTGHQW